MENKQDLVIEDGILKKYVGSGGDVTVPEGVTEIGDQAFMGCTGLTSVTIPEGVAEIGEYVFSGCTGLTSVTIPEGVARIGTLTFGACRSLEEVHIPASVTKIASNAFFKCGDGDCAARRIKIFAPAGSCAESYAKSVPFCFCPEVR